MQQEVSMPVTAKPAVFRAALFRLLAINLGIGVSIAALLVGGLLWLDVGGLRHLIVADRSPAVALGLLLFGFVITFGSTAMGTAIMAMGRRPRDDDEPPAGKGKLATLAVRSKAR
jgi:hypothetical protein